MPSRRLSKNPRLYADFIKACKKAAERFGVEWRSDPMAPHLPEVGRNVDLGALRRGEYSLKQPAAQALVLR